MSKINGQNYFNKGVNNNSKFHIYSKGYFFYNLKKPELNTIDYANNTHMLEYNFKNDPLSNFRSENCDQSKKKLKNILKNQFLCNALPLMKINKKVVSNKSENSEIFERKCELINLDKVYIHKNEKNTLYTVKLKKKLVFFLIPFSLLLQHLVRLRSILYLLFALLLPLSQRLCASYASLIFGLTFFLLHC